jgi:MFS family permease
MFRMISRNNRLFMLGNSVFALSYGLWMNLRQLHLLDLGATPAQIGGVFALVALAGGLLPLPAGLLADRIGPKRVIQAAWLIAAAGALTAALAPSWQWPPPATSSSCSVSPPTRPRSPTCCSTRRARARRGRR